MLPYAIGCKLNGELVLSGNELVIANKNGYDNEFSFR